MTIADSGGDISARESKNYIFGRFIDFFCLGGGSLPVLYLMAMLPPDEYKPYVLAVVMLMTVFINHPHFIHSYQIFYSNFGAKTAQDAPLRWRYLIAGVYVPIAIVLFFMWSIISVDAALMAKMANVMLFLVGWHYTKQGYGILIVESVLKRAFFTEVEKTMLRYNALIVWLTSWLYLNHVFMEQEIYGMQFFTLGLPTWLYTAMQGLCVVASVLTAGMLLRKLRSGRLPLNGLLAYVTSSYVWLLFSSSSPLVVLVIPAFHSIQYLAIVWRYQLNKAEAHPMGDGRLFGGLINTTPARAATVQFALAGTMIGILVFYAVPFTLDMAIAYREEVFGTTMFLFTFIIFINVHHYFMDNVIWRKDNPDIKEHLFS